MRTILTVFVVVLGLLLANAETTIKPSGLTNGSIITLKCMGSASVSSHQYLEAPTSGVISLAGASQAAQNSTHWKVRTNSDNSVSLLNVAAKNNTNRILNGKTEKGTLDLVTKDDAKTLSGTRWAVEKLPDGGYSLKNLGTINTPAHVYLNGETVMGKVNLVANHDPKTLSGTHWKIDTFVAPVANTTATNTTTITNVTINPSGLTNGTIVTLKCMGDKASATHQVLDNQMSSGKIVLSTVEKKSTGSTSWRVRINDDKSVSFQNLASKSTAASYLNGYTETGGLALAMSTKEKSFSGTHWAVDKLSDGTYALKNLGLVANTKYIYLNGETKTGKAELVANTNEKTLSGTHWKIEKISA